MEWIKVGHRSWPYKQHHRIGKFRQLTDYPVKYYTQLRDQGLGFTALKITRRESGYTDEWILFKSAVEVQVRSRQGGKF